jgi:hypothetical protein
MDALIPAVVIGGVVYVAATQSSSVPASYPPPGASNSPLLNDAGQAGFNLFGRPTDPAVQPKLDILQQSAKASFDAMDGASRSAAAAAMNQALELDPPLSGSDTWDTVVQVAAGAAGAAACNAIPGIGTAASPLCAIGAAYLGVKLEDWIGQGVDQLENWAGSAYDSAKDAVDGAIGWISNIF